jgi:hypothetical protein
MSGQGGVVGFEDTFFGDLDKSFVDCINEDLTNIRGQQILYFVKRDQTLRIDGTAPGQDAKGIPPVTGLRKRSGGIIGAMYGEPTRVGARIDSVRREVTHVWNYADPVKLFAVALEPASDENPDERGTTYARTLRVDIARTCAENAGIRPRQGDVIQLVNLLGAFYDIEDVGRDESRFGGDGNFHVFQCSLAKNSKFVPPRKILPGGLGYESLED